MENKLGTGETPKVAWELRLRGSWKKKGGQHAIRMGQG